MDSFKKKNISFSTWGGKKTPRTFAWPFFCYRFFFFLIVLQGIVITVTNIIDFVLQTYFAWHHCPTQLPVTLSVGEGGSKAGGDSGAVGGSGKGSFAARGAEGRSWRRGLFLLKPYRFGYRSVIVLAYVFPTFFCMLKLRCSVTRRG